MRLLITVLLFGFCMACASVQAPQGGPKDTTKPRLTTANPSSGTTNFNGKAIILEFTEDVAENNAKQLLISPKLPVTLVPGTKRMKITADSGFKPNTTYTLLFNRKIKDDREGNLMPDTVLRFSTGSAIDTLSVRIMPMNLSNKQEQRKVLATLKGQNNQLYFASADSLKPLQIEGLAPGKYGLEVYADGNENYQYDEDDGALFFDSISVEKNELLTVTPLPQKHKPVKIFKQVRNDTISFEATGPVRLPKQLMDKVVYRSPKMDNYRMYPYSAREVFAYTDSLGNVLNDTLDKALIDTSRSLNNFPQAKTTTVRLEQKKAIVKQTFDWNIELKPRTMEITQDSVWVKVDPKIGANSLEFTLPKAATGKVKMRFDTLSFYNEKGYKLDSMMVEKADLEATGDISGIVTTDMGAKLVIELLNDKGDVVATGKGKTYLFHVKPGKYFLQLYADLNQDGLYTGGNKEKRRKAEPLYKYDTAIELKPGWDIEKLVITPGF